jgi:uncharacterized membrane protein YccF (DUF307 family)
MKNVQCQIKVENSYCVLINMVSAGVCGDVINELLNFLLAALNFGILSLTLPTQKAVYRSTVTENIQYSTVVVHEDITDKVSGGEKGGRRGEKGAWKFVR